MNKIIKIMGQFACCRKSLTFSPKNKFLCQIIRFKHKKDNNGMNDINNNNCFLNISSCSDNSNNNINNINDEKIGNDSINDDKPNHLKENLLPNKGKYKLLFYDITLNNTLIIERKLEIVKSLEGLSELNLEQKLYLCGNSRLEDNEGSFLFELDPLNPKTKILVNSIYGHYYPSLISFENKCIYCIGGKNQIHCEKYNIEKNCWLALPNLPEERYMSTICFDSNNSSLYLFGGINSKKQNINETLYIENNNILRLKKQINLIWEKIEIKTESEKKLLKRISAGSLVFNDQEDNIYILGGESEQKYFLNDIIKFNIKTFSFSDTNKKLEFPTIFFNQYPKKCQGNNFIYVFFDKFNNIIKIDKHDFVEYSYDILNTL